MIDVIHVPADTKKPMQIRQIDPASEAEYIQYLAEPPRRLALKYPDATMFTPVDAVDFPGNLRASLILGVHNNDHRESYVYGDALIGGPDNTGYPAELEDLLFITKVRFVQVRAQGKKNWLTQLTPYSRWQDAYNAALTALDTYPNAEEVRVIPDGHPW